MREQTGLKSAQSKPARQISALDIYQEKVTRPPTSTIRYRPTDGTQVVRSGNKQLAIHHGLPRTSWLAPAGMGSLATLVVIAIVIVLIQAIGNWQTDQRYGMPRTYQTDKDVGHGGVSHFRVENLQGHIFVTELPNYDASKAKIYAGPTLAGANADKVPVEVEFSDQTGKGMVDMVLIINGEGTVFLNNGKEFCQPQQGGSRCIS